MSNKIETYSGRSIAEQLLEGTGLGNLLYGKPKTYKDGYGKTRSHASFKESANGQLVQRMGETAKDAGNLVATGLAFGNPMTASAYIAPLITGSQAYGIAHGINDGAQRIENIGEGIQNFVEDPTGQNAGYVVAEVPMLALDVAGALPVAKTVIETGKNVIPAAQQAAQRIVGSVDDAITTATKQAVESGAVGVNELPAQLAARVTSTPKVQEPLQLPSPEMRKILTHGIKSENFIKIVNGQGNKSLPNPSLMATPVDNAHNGYGDVILLGDESLLKNSYFFNGDGGTSTVGGLGPSVDDINVQEISRRMKYLDDHSQVPRISELDLRRKISNNPYDYGEVKRIVPTPITDFKHAFISKSNLTPELQNALKNSGIPFTITTNPIDYEIKSFVSQNPQFKGKQGGKIK